MVEEGDGDVPRFGQGGFMRGHCRLVRTKAGVTAFARVWVEARSGGDAVEVIDALPDQVNHHEGEVNRRTAPEWVEAALEGIRTAVAQARARGLLGAGCRV